MKSENVGFEEVQTPWLEDIVKLIWVFHFTIVDWLETLSQSFLTQTKTKQNKTKQKKKKNAGEWKYIERKNLIKSFYYIFKCERSLQKYTLLP